MVKELFPKDGGLFSDWIVDSPSISWSRGLILPWDLHRWMHLMEISVFLLELSRYAIQINVVVLRALFFLNNSLPVVLKHLAFAKEPLLFRQAWIFFVEKWEDLITVSTHVGMLGAIQKEVKEFWEFKPRCLFHLNNVVTWCLFTPKYSHKYQVIGLYSVSWGPIFLNLVKPTEKMNSKNGISPWKMCCFQPLLFSPKACWHLFSGQLKQACCAT